MIYDGSLIELFQVRTGVRQGCLLPPILFLAVLNWVTRRAYGTGRTGLREVKRPRLRQRSVSPKSVLL